MTYMAPQPTPTLYKDFSNFRDPNLVENEVSNISDHRILCRSIEDDDRDRVVMCTMEGSMLREEVSEELEA